MNILAMFFLSQVYPHSYDVSFYGIYLTIDPAADSIFGSGEIAGAVPGSVDSLDFHLGSALTVDSILLDGAQASFNRVDDTVWVKGSSSPISGDFDILVYYHGRPTAGLYFNYWGFFTSCLWVDRLKDAHQWFPCYDHNGDKADSARLVWTVPQDFDVASNGTLDTVTVANGWKTYSWTVHHPIANYLIAVSGSDKYVFFTDTWRGMPLWYYAFTIDSSDLRVDVENVPDMLDYFSMLFGDYPFMDEKFGYAESNLLGGGFSLEHQTMVAMGTYFITGDHQHELTFAHELSHQWWGDLITCRDWPHVWLNEGFASYCEALYAEHRGGVPERDSVLESFKNLYFGEDAQDRFPIYDPPIDHIWGYTVYKKGAWVLHMLRWVMGDSLFFQGLRDYRAAYEGGTATIPEFQAIMESVYGSSLGWFFTEWIYEAGYPEMDYNWFVRDTGGAYLLDVYLRQVQENAPVFIMPMEIMAANASDTLRDTVWVNEMGERFSWSLPFAPDTVILDPENWILKKLRYTEVAEVPAPSSELWLAVVSNPTRSVLRIRYSLPGPGPVSLRIYDPAGRALGTLMKGQATAGTHTLGFPVQDLSPGVYFLRLKCEWGSLSRKFVVVR